MNNQQIAREIGLAIGGQTKFQGSVGVIKTVLDKHSDETAAERDNLANTLSSRDRAIHEATSWMGEYSPITARIEAIHALPAVLKALVVLLLESLLVKEQLRVTQNSLRVLLAWCDRMLIDDKHLIGSICKEADDTSFRHAISEAEKILKEGK